MHRNWIGISLAALLVLPAQAQQSRDFGSPEEALMMLQRVIGAMRADQAKALHLLNEGAPGFRKANLYLYCGDASGAFTAHPDLLGASMRDMRDSAATH